MLILTLGAVAVQSVALALGERPHARRAPVEVCALIRQTLQEVAHVLLRAVGPAALLLPGVVVLAVHPVWMQLPPVIRKDAVN